MVDRSSPYYDSNMSTSLPQSQEEASSKAEDECMGWLPPDFVPEKWEVICQRGKECFDHGK
jgi:hypothetical protein